MAFVSEDIEEEFKDDCVFKTPEVIAIVKAAINEILEKKSYDEKVITQDTNKVLENIVAGLMELQKPFKYIVNCVITPKLGNGIHTGNICHWSEEHDRALTVRWENNYLCVIATVFGVGFFQSKVPVIDNIVGKFRRQGKRLIPLSKSKHTN